MTTISRLFPELEKDEKSPHSHTDSAVVKTESSESGQSSPSRNDGIDSSCDSGRVSTPASLVDEPRFQLKTEKTLSSFRPWEESTSKERVPELGLHHQEQATTTAPAPLNPLANWALNYPLFSQAAAVAAIQQNAALAALSGQHQHQHLQQQHHQQQLLQQLFINQQQKNMQAYNAYRLQTELNKTPKVASLERPWETSVNNGTTATTTSPKTNDKPVKMETDAKVEKPKSKEKKDNGNKPYKCPICDAQFNRPANLKTHLRIHSGEKPYKCDTCSARFVQVAHLRAHVLIHTGEKPYPCQVCGTRFRHLQTLKSHIRIHTGEKPFSCDECDLKFRHKSQLRLHLRTKHNINTNTKKSYTFVPGLNSADLSKMIKDSNKTSTSNCSHGAHEHKCCSSC